MTKGGEHYQAAERLLAKARALPPSELAQRQALLDEASAQADLAQVAATMESHLHAGPSRRMPGWRLSATASPRRSRRKPRSMTWRRAASPATYTRTTPAVL
jgi:hypothetical protein